MWGDNVNVTGESYIVSQLNAVSDAFHGVMNSSLSIRRRKHFCGSVKDEPG